VLKSSGQVSASRAIDFVPCQRAYQSGIDAIRIFAFGAVAVIVCSALAIPCP
jgi:hypothetical protein